ncbi:MAG TPA: hypothetical protein VF422_02615, partial [Dokdonella sp.]
MNLSPELQLVLATAVGLLAGALLVYLLSRRWVAAAQATGRMSREGELGALAGQRDAASARADELAMR